MGFPEGFVWGAATNSFSVEGAAFEDGKSLSVWDTFCLRDGATWRGQVCDVACDHYHRYKQDVALMKEMSLQAYRFSISWPRVLPEGIGKVNTQGLAFYDRLLDELLMANITPFVDLFVWDYPLCLHEKGGWLLRESTDWFAEYAEAVVKRLGDRVHNWITFNEPQVFAHLGYQVALHGPGERLPMADLARIAHHILLAHGKAVSVIRSGSREKTNIGIVMAGIADVPKTESEKDIAAARRSSFDKWAVGCTEWWTDPIIFGKYPRNSIDPEGEGLPPVCDGDMAIISAPIDFLGLNVYAAQTVRAGEDGKPEIVPPAPGNPITGFNWDVLPASLYWIPRFVYERYGIPLYITENGMSNRDVVSLDGEVHDPQRVDFITRYLRELERAVGDGVDVRGYFHWTLMDNFECAEGFKERFGLIFVDFVTQERILKDSAHWYRKIIKSRGATIRET